MDLHSRILCLGPRSNVELDLLRESRLGTPVGLDLWPTSSDITGGDIHSMPFGDRSFDLIFVSHVFEHAYNFSTVASECLRVLRPGGYIYFEVPQNFEPNEHDTVSFNGVSEVLQGFAGSSVSVIFQESGLDGKGQDFLRGLLQPQTAGEARPLRLSQLAEISLIDSPDARGWFPAAAFSAPLQFVISS